MAQEEYKHKKRGSTIGSAYRYRARIGIHTNVATRLLRDATRYRKAKTAGLLPDNNTNRRKSEKTGQDTQLLIMIPGNYHTHNTSTRLHGYLVVARLCFTPYLHRGIHTRRACVRTSQCHFFIISHRFFSSVVPTPAGFCCSVTSTSGISCNLAVQFDIPPRQKTVSKS